MKTVLIIFNNPRSPLVFALSFLAVCLFYAIELLVALVPFYDTGIYMSIINKTQGCQKVKSYQSFQYACLIGTSIIMASFGTIIGLNCMKRPSNLAQMLSYSRLSLRFLGKIIITICLGVVPLAIFLNPLWNRIQTSDIGKTMIEWATMNIALFFAIFFIVYLSPIINGLLGLEQYKNYSSFADYKKF